MDRNTIFASVAIFVIGCLIGLYLIYLPKMEELRFLREMQQEEEERRHLVDDIATLEKKVAGYQEHRVPPGNEENELLNLVREIAGESNVRVTAMAPESEGERERRRYKKFSLTISFEGTYHLLGDFIARIENAQRVMKIDMLEFNVSQTEGELPLECRMTLSVFTTP